MQYESDMPGLLSGNFLPVKLYNDGHAPCSPRQDQLHACRRGWDGHDVPVWTGYRNDFPTLQADAFLFRRRLRLRWPEGVRR